MTKIIQILSIVLCGIYTSQNSQACDNNCWLNANANILVANAQYLHDHPNIALIVDEICMQGRPITQQQINVNNQFGFHNPQECRRATPTPTATATPTATVPMPTPTPTATATLTPRPSPTVRPSPSPTAHPSPTRPPQASPTPTPSPSASPTPTPCIPTGQCTFSTVEWLAQYPNWPATAGIQLGSHLYSQQQAFAILAYPGDAGDDLSRLCRELVAEALNESNGSPHQCVDQYVNDANQLIGNLVPRPVGNDTHTPDPRSMNDILHLTQYNKGLLCCASHCVTGNYEYNQSE